ncbi:MAG: RNA polymerase sigma factor [Planctomycetota bacterium]|jgi:RNA polymerase sigma-70 factor (ECF subfamily)
MDFPRPFRLRKGVCTCEKLIQRDDVQNVEKDKLVRQEPDSVLVEAAVKGDADSFTELCRRYYPAMVAIGHSILGDRHLAEDAAQQAFANAVRKLPQLRKKSRFAKWLAAICRNAALDLAGDNKAVGTIDNLSTVAAESKGNDAAQAVREAIGRLSASDREVIFLRFYDGMTYESISAVLGISTQAINGRLRRAKKKIAGHLRRAGFAEVDL